MLGLITHPGCRKAIILIQIIFYMVFFALQAEGEAYQEHRECTGSSQERRPECCSYVIFYSQ